jgi:TRAP-type mannitol/chloroaromatic compound transport system substrate-binding protein
MVKKNEAAVRDKRAVGEARSSSDWHAQVTHRAKAREGKAMKLKRRQVLTAIGVSAGASIAKPAIAQSMPNIKWRLAASWPKSLDTAYGSCEMLAKRVAEITDSQFQIQVFAAGEIVPALAVLDAVQAGTVEIGHTSAYYYWGKDSALALGTAVPFGLNTRQMESWLRHGGGNELVQEVFASFGCFGIPRDNTGAQMGGWFRKEINKFRPYSQRTERSPNVELRDSAPGRCYE